jgi:hypothetical protein
MPNQNPFTSAPAKVQRPLQIAQQVLLGRAKAQTPRRTARILRWSTELWLSIWFNEDGLTPQQACDAFGNLAGYMLLLGQATAQWYAAICPGADPVLMPPTGCKVTPNQDGTITIDGWDVSMQEEQPAWAVAAMSDELSANAM